MTTHILRFRVEPMADVFSGVGEKTIRHVMFFVFFQNRRYVIYFPEEAHPYVIFPVMEDDLCRKVVPHTFYIYLHTCHLLCIVIKQ